MPSACGSGSSSDFWLPERGHYALALDGAKRPLDSLTSNIGQLLWSGIVADEHAERTAASLLGEQLFTGWGVRTMGTGDVGYSPLSYHNGTVWPHDNSLIAAGLARYGFREQANRLIRGMLAAAPHFEHRLPEVFAGYAAELTGVPVVFPDRLAPAGLVGGSTAAVDHDDARADTLAGRSDRRSAAAPGDRVHRTAQPERTRRDDRQPDRRRHFVTAP